MGDGALKPGPPLGIDRVGAGAELGDGIEGLLMAGRCIGAELGDLVAGAGIEGIACGIARSIGLAEGPAPGTVTIGVLVEGLAAGAGVWTIIGALIRGLGAGDSTSGDGAGLATEGVGTEREREIEGLA